MLAVGHIRSACRPVFGRRYLKCRHNASGVKLYGGFGLKSLHVIVASELARQNHLDSDNAIQPICRAS